MNTTLYHEKIRNLRNEGTFDDKLLSAFTQWMIKAEDWDLFRINPVKLAASLELPEPSMIDFFVHGSRVGLFDFSWSMICPSCGEIQNNDHSLNALEGEFHCVVCQAPVQVNIDDTVEVTFTLNPAIRSLNLDPFKDAGTYRAAFFSAAVDRSPAILEYMNTIWVGFEAIPPQETLIIDRTWKRGKSYRFVSAGVHSQFVFHVDPEASDVQEIYPVDFGENGMSPEELTIKSTNGQFRIQNRRYDTVGLMMVEADFPKLHALMKSHPGKMLPMLTGNQLLSNQKFRELFKMQNLSPALRLNIRSLTLLFTDLKGSTELYDRTGDVDAYNLIQEHFKLLEKIVSRHGGAVIKTMGDAVMASFSRPSDGVNAAIDMLRENMEMTQGQKPLGLKIGLHEGPALAINNRGALDYFGQTVNIAARVQGLAGENTLWMTESVLRSRGVANNLKENKYVGKRYQASLKGVGERTTVFELKQKEHL